ncbi:MAG: hypothetical protein NT045_06325 [Candidatus Aureabacteria bacterium]|nr:hypothetical protein [Candidatus Auribacterota bacterium]
MQKDSVTLGSNVELHLEIVPDHLASVAIVLGIIRPDEKMYYYKGQAKGFALFEGFDSARPLATDFPFNTSMSVVQSVALPADWPAGKYQFIAAVMKDGSVIEIDHSNCFTATAGTREKAEGGK